MTKVQFIKVGRGKRTWTSEMQKVTPNLLADEVARSGALMSRDIEVEWDIDTMKGKIYAGFHSVGTFEILG